MTPPASLEQGVAAALAASGVDLAALGVAWARALPVVILVPAFGLRALPGPARATLALALAAGIAPGVRETGGVALLEGAVRGTSVAIAAAVPLWAATMAGGVADAVRASEETARSPVVPGQATPLGVLLSVLASAIFLAGGGASRALGAVMRAGGEAHPLLAASQDLVAGIALAVAIAGPVLAASVVLEVGGALVTRASAPVATQALLPPVRTLAILVVLALGLDRIAEALARAMR